MKYTDTPDYEIKSASMYGNTGEDAKKDTNIDAKIKRARQLASFPLAGDEHERVRRTLAAVALSAQADTDIPETVREQLKQKIEEFIKGDATLLDLHEWTLKNFLLEANIEDRPAELAFEIKTRVYKLLKAFLGSILPLEAVTVTDAKIDEVKNAWNSNQFDFDFEYNLQERIKFSKNLEEILKTIVDFLKKYSNIKGIGVVYNEPLTNEEKTIKAGDARTEDIQFLAESIKEEENIKPESEKKDEYERQLDNSRHLLIKMRFGEKVIGIIDFIFEGEFIDPLIETTCRHVKNRIDTHIDTGLDNVLKELIQQAHETILEKHSLAEWKEICKEYMEILNSLGINPVLITKRFDLLTEGVSEITHEGVKDRSDVPLKYEMTAKLFELQCEVFEMRFPQFFSADYLEEHGQTQHDAELMGTLLVKCKNATERQLVNHISKSIEDMLKRREELRTRLIQIFGLQIANAYMDGNLETLGQHEIAILIGDINGYSKFAQALEDAVKKGKFKEKENLLAIIMKDFTEKISVAIDRDKELKELKGILDNIFGDAIVMMFRPPFDKEGRDVFGKQDEEHDISLFINNALKMCAKASEILKSILVEIEKTYSIKLPWHPEFSFGIKTVSDVVGIFGNAKHPYSRLQYTAFGTGINETARIQSAAKAGAVLVDYDTWMKYKEGGRDDFTEVGIPFLVEGKNIKDPIPVVSVLLREKVEAAKNNQEQILNEKAGERSNYRQKEKDKPFYFWDENTYENMPDGDYYVTREGIEEKGPYSPVLSFGDHSFPVRIPKDRIVELEYPISMTTERMLEEERANNQYTRRSILRKSGSKFILIRHVNIDRIAERQLRQALDLNQKIGQNHLNISQMPAGKYEIVDSKKQDDGDIVITLIRGSTVFNVIIPAGENVLQGEIIKNGYLRHKKGLCFFEPKIY